MNNNSSYECAKSLRTAAKILKGVGIALVCIGGLCFFYALDTGSGLIFGNGFTSLIAGIISFFVFWVLSLFCSAIAEITMNTRECADYMETILSEEEDDEND